MTYIVSSGTLNPTIPYTLNNSYFDKQRGNKTCNMQLVISVTCKIIDGRNLTHRQA